MLKGKPWQIALGVIGALLLILGQVAINQSHFGTGAAYTALGVLCAAAAFILPLVPWGRAAELLSLTHGLMEALALEEQNTANRPSSKVVPGDLLTDGPT